MCTSLPQIPTGRDGAAARREQAVRCRRSKHSHGIEGAGLQTRGPIKQNVVPDDVLEEQSYAATDDGLAVLVRIPRKSNLRRKVQVRLR